MRWHAGGVAVLLLSACGGPVIREAATLTVPTPAPSTAPVVAAPPMVGTCIDAQGQQHPAWWWVCRHAGEDDPRLTEAPTVAAVPTRVPAPAPVEAVESRLEAAACADPEQLVIDPLSAYGQAVRLEGTALTVQQFEASTWVQLRASVPGGPDQAPISVAVEFTPKQPAILPNTALVVYGVTAGMERVSPARVGALREVPAYSQWGVNAGAARRNWATARSNVPLVKQLDPDETDVHFEVPLVQGWAVQPLEDAAPPLRCASASNG